jgi:hypothetical protein
MNIDEYQLILKRENFFEGELLFDFNKDEDAPFSLPYSLFSKFAREFDFEKKKLKLYFNKENFKNATYAITKRINYQNNSFYYKVEFGFLLFMIIICFYFIKSRKIKCIKKKINKEEKKEELIYENKKK